MWKENKLTVICLCGKQQRFFMFNREVARFPIRFDFFYGILSSFFLCPPHDSYVEIERESVRVKMGWAFRSEFPRSAIINEGNLSN